MFTPQSLTIALLMMITSAICWGSWANTYKGVKNYRFELFYWDYAIGIFLISLVLALTMGSTGHDSSSFLDNVRAADPSNIVSTLVGGAIFNLANLLLVAAIDMAGLAVAFPVSIGIALVAKPVGSTIKVIWAIPSPFVGFVTGDDPNSWCNVSIEGDLDYSDSQQTVPLSVFDRKGPVTLSYTSSRHLTKDNLGHPADIHYDWTYSITFRRIPSHGAPPGGGCRVPKLVGKTLTAAKQALRKTHCKLGKVVQVPSRAKKDMVLAQHPLPGANLPAGSKVDLYVSRGH